MSGNESDYSQRYKKIYRAVNDSIDMNNSDLDFLLRGSLQNHGVIPDDRKNRMVTKGHPLNLVETIQRIITKTRQADSENPAEPD